MFEPKDVLKRVQKLGDLFAPVLTLKQKLPRLNEIREAGDKALNGLA
jgi:bifunctional non-homologous end joining protein LigD